MEFGSLTIEVVAVKHEKHKSMLKLGRVLVRLCTAQHFSSLHLAYQLFVSSTACAANRSPNDKDLHCQPGHRLAVGGAPRLLERHAESACPFQQQGSRQRGVREVAGR